MKIALVNYPGWPVCVTIQAGFDVGGEIFCPRCVGVDFVRVGDDDENTNLCSCGYAWIEHGGKITSPCTSPNEMVFKPWFKELCDTYRCTFNRPAPEVAAVTMLYMSGADPRSAAMELYMMEQDAAHTPPEQMFTRWMGEVDKVLSSIMGATSDDLPDCDYRMLFEDGYWPSEAAQQVRDDLLKGW